MRDATLHKQIAQHALGILSGPERWTQHTDARNRRGDSVEIKDPDACRFCLRGAVNRATDELCLPYGATLMFQEIICRLTKGGMPFWNDAPERTYEDVVGVLRQIA